MLDYVLIGLITIIVISATLRGLSSGFPIAIACLVFLPEQLQIPFPGQLPDLSIHRIILLILLVRWIQFPAKGPSSDGLRLTFVLTLALISRGISDLLSVTPGPSIKDLLWFTFEHVFYYHLARSALANAQVRTVAVRVLVGTLTAVAFLAFIERYLRVSVPRIVFSDFRYLSDGIQSTYPHRILLGYAMAMGTPLTLHLIDIAPSKGWRRAYWLCLCALIVTCFIADSRGGWLGMGLGGTVSFLIGTRSTRRRCLGLLALAFVALMSRPGVRETIVSRLQDTFYADSYKGVSYQYRWLLWGVASAEISRSPERLLFGYGGQSTESMDLSRHFRRMQGGTADKIGFTSWDNHYASDLIEFGVIGLALEVLLYALIIARLFRYWRRGPPGSPDRNLVGAILASCLVFMFARSNVFIFGVQPNFLFWTIVALGSAVVASKPKTYIRPRLTPVATEKPALT